MISSWHIRHVKVNYDMNQRMTPNRPLTSHELLNIKLPVRMQYEPERVQDKQG